MTIATREHLQAFNQVTLEIVLLAPQLEAASVSALAVVDHNATEGNLDGAIIAGATSFGYLQGEYNRLMGGFQTAVADLMGEHPAPGESQVDFFGRIYHLGAEGWLAMAKRNGVTLNQADEGRING